MSLRDLLADPTARLDFTLELHARSKDGEKTVHWFSTHGKRTGAGDDPPSTEMRPLLSDPGHLRLALDGDDLANLGASAQPVRLKSGSDPDCLDGLGNFELTGETFVVRVGSPELPHRDYEPVSRGRIRREPALEADVLAIDVEPLDVRLDTPLRLPRWLGIPTAVDVQAMTGDRITVPHRAEYDLPDFALLARFRAEGLPGSVVDLLSKGSNYRLRLEPDGTVSAAAGPVSLASTLAYADGALHWVGFSRGPERAYLAVDGEVVDEISNAAIPAPSTADLFLLHRQGTLTALVAGLDCRLYGRYLPVQETVLAMSSPVSVEDVVPGVLGAWELGDGVGDSVTDWSPLAHPGAGTGLVWIPSRGGEPELTGGAYPATLGEVRNAEAPLESEDHQQFRVGTPGLLSGPGSVEVKSRGLPAVGTYDPVEKLWTATAGLPDEPVTFDVPPALTTGHHLDRVLEDVLVRLGPIDTGELDSDAWESFRALLPALPVGWLPESEATVGEVAQALLSPLGAHLAWSRNGKVRPGVLLPPLAPGPFGKPVPDFRGLAGARAEWLDLPSPGGSFTVALWCKLLRTDLSPKSAPGAFVGPYPGPTLATQTGGFYLGAAMEDPSRVVWHHPDLAGGGSLLSPSGVLQWAEWHFVMATYNAGLGRREIFVGKPGQSLVPVTTEEGVAGSLNGGSLPVQVGPGTAGAVTQVMVWSRPLLPVEGELAMAGNLGGGLLFHAPLNEGAGTAPVERVTSQPGTLTGGARWRPDLVVDLDQSAKGSYQARKLRPSGNVEVLWGKNWAPLGPGDQATGLTPSESRDLKRPWRRAFLPSPRPELTAKVLETALVRQGDAVRLGARTLSRGRPGRGIAVVRTDDRRAYLLELLDEVQVRGRRFGLEKAPVFRVVSLDPNYTEGTVEFGGWGDLPEVET